MRRLSIILSMLVLGALTMPSRAAAQQPPQQPPGQLVFTYVTQWNVPRAQWADMGKVFADLKPTVNRLVDDGTLTGYGFFENLVRTENSGTHGVWIEAGSISGILQALAALQPKTTASPVLVNAKEHDEFLRSTTNGSKSGTFQNGYLWVASFPMKQGHAADWNNVFGRVVKPVLDQLLADGTLAGYRYEGTLIHHSEGSWSTYAYFGLSSDASDHVETAMRAALGANLGSGALVDANMRDEGISNTLARIIEMREK
jgi:hypothetical protein